MAHFYRLIFCALFVAAVFAHRPVFAALPSPLVQNLEGGGCGRYGWQSMPAVLDGCVNRGWTCTFGVSFFEASTGRNEVMLNCVSPGPSQVYMVVNQPENANLSGSSFVCNSGFTESSGACVAAADAPPVGPTAAEACAEISSWKYKGTTMAYAGSQLSRTACFKGQTVLASNAIMPRVENYIFGPYTCPGTPCSEGLAMAVAPTNPAQALDSVDCAKSGGQWGRFNGVGVCIPSAAPAGNTPGISAPGPSTITKADGTVISTAQTTTCDGTNCTTSTTTTTTPPGGTALLATEAAVKPQQSFCAENPAAPMCKESRYSGGSCAAPPACDGDPIQCGIARQTWAAACALDPSDTPETDAGRSAALLTGDQSENLPGNRAMSLTAASFDQTPIFTSAGMSDLSLTVAGHSLVLPLSSVNYWLEMLGNIGVAVAFLAAIKITFGGSFA